MSNTLYNIRDKYLHDTAAIKDYVQYLENFFITFIRMNNNLHEISPTFFSKPIAKNICDNNGTIQGEMYSYFQKVQEEMNELDVKEKISGEPSSEDPNPRGDLLMYLSTEIHKGEKDKKTLLKDAMGFVEAMCISKGELKGFEDFDFLYDNPSEIEKLVDIAFEDEKRRKYKSLHAEKTYVGNSIKALESFDASNPLNMHKQNFIQIMAYFDSCIFDMVKACMEKDLFEWLAYFENVNIKTHDMSLAGTFDNFKLRHIESTLKKCYVKDLLNILHEKQKDIFEINGNDVYAQLQEMIGRRNVHIHHNGIADQTYIGNFNIYGFTSGDYLQISKDYFEETIKLTTQLVASIATSC